MASNDRTPLIRPSVPAQRASMQVSLVKRRSAGDDGPAVEPAGPVGSVNLIKRISPVGSVSLVKRVNLSKRSRPRISLVKRPPARPPAGPRRRSVPSPTRVFSAATTGAVRSARATKEWSRRPSGRMLLPGLLMAVLVALATTGGALLPGATGAAPGAAGPESSAPPSEGAEAPGLPDDGKESEDPQFPGDDPSAPGASTGPSGQAGAGSGTLAGWAAPMAVRTDIPLVALQAYAMAELTVTRTTPACGLRWTTLAGIGKVESNHGRIGGATLAADGRSSQAIYGPVLDGTNGNQLIRDTDHGQLDGDSTFDRAIGPMQFIPSTWTRYAVDADNSGTADPHDIDDAALAAANYLCADGRNLSTGAGWSDAILKYNNLQAYVQNVFNAANDYGIRSRG